METAEPDRRAVNFTAHVVPHTHWDREWYEPFESFRGRLVHVLDRVLALLESDSEYRGFTLDGQTVLVEDYLDVRPHARARIEELVRAGRLSVGPWYVLADEFLVSPEALVRNLLLGKKTSEALGARINVAYTPDSFGHISQLPLLASEFGLEAIVFERGLGDEGEKLGAEFIWESADGTRRMFAVHLVGTYSAVAAAGHSDWEFGDEYSSYQAVQHARAAIFGPENADILCLPDWLRDSFERFQGGMIAYANSRALLLLNGSDHLYAQENLPELVRDWNRGLPTVRFIQSDLTSFIADARESAGELNAYRGEFRGSRYQHILSGVLSARMYLKQQNHAAETRLEKHCEPLAALAWLYAGQAYDAGLMEHAWGTLLKNHPHDSICGCSVDSVHRQMMCRFERVHHTADYLEQRAFSALSGCAGERHVVVFNPHPVALSELVHAELTVPDGEGRKLRVFDREGSVVAHTLAVERIPAPGESSVFADHVKIALQAALPPLGVTSVALLRDDRSAAASAAPAERNGLNETPGTESVLAVRAPDGTIALDNGVIRVEVATDGALEITKTASGAVMRPRLSFEDAADAGDEYDFSPLAGDEPVHSGRPAKPPELVHASGLEATVRLTWSIRIPESLDARRTRRIGSLAHRVSVDLTVAVNSPVLAIRVRLSNRVRDHRLRIKVATGCRAESVIVEGHYDVLRRALRPPDGQGWFQTPQATNHQRRFTAVEDGAKGLAILNRGLPEYEAAEGRDGVDVFVTLLRCVGWLSRADLVSRPQPAGPTKPTPEAQCIGEHQFDLGLLVYSGVWHDCALVHAAERFAASPRVYVSCQPAAGCSAASLDPPLVLTAVKRAEARDSLILRVWNPAPRTVSGALVLGFSAREAYRTRMDETRVCAEYCEDRRVRLSMLAREVRSLEIVPERTHESASGASAAGV